MTINVYQSIMPGEPDEIYHDHGITVGQWLTSMTPNYQPGETQPVSCAINGTIIPPGDWGWRVIGETDVVEFRVVPHGGIGDAIGFALPFWGGSVAAANAAIKYITPDIPGQRGQGSQGSSLDPAEAKANVARLGEGVPEVFGRYIRYPDYLNQPRTFYQGKTTQVIRLFLSVGAGRYVIDDSNVKIGETPFNDVNGASYEIFEPGQDVSGSPNHENWFPSSEVGATTGGAGIRLKGVTFDQRTYAGSATGSGSTLSGISVGEFWEAGNEGVISFTQSITVIDGGMSPPPETQLPDIFSGAFQHLAAGMTVNISSDVGINGTYVVSTISGGGNWITLETTGGSEVIGTTPGNGSMSIDKAGTKYRLLTKSSTAITVERILTSGAADPDWSALPSATMQTEIEWEVSTFTGIKSGPYTACPSGETTTEVEIDIFCPQGLGSVDGERINARSRTISIQWREVGGVTWNEQTVTVSGATRDQLGFTFPISLESAQRPEFRVGRIGGEDVSVTSLDRIEWTALRAKLPTVTSYPGITTMAVTIVGADDIASQSNNRINLIPTRILPNISGGAFTAEVESRRISSAAAYVAKSLGYADDQIDLDALEQLEAIWTPRGDAFDYVISNGTAKDAIDMILRAGFAEMTLDTGVIKPVRDQIRTKLEDGYSPENMTAPLTRSFEARQVDESDGVEVEYTDAETWTTETVLCLLPGDQQIKLDKIKINGVTDRTRAWRIGMRRRRAQKYRRWSYSFSTELDALNSEYLSCVPLLDDVPGYGQVAILEAISADMITVSEPMEFEPGKKHVVAYRAEDGETIGPFPCTQGPNAHTLLVSIPKPWPAALPADREPIHIYFGTTERWSFPALIADISPQGPASVSVEAVNYDARVYADDDSAPA
ncbi:MAG: hypothetical protein ACI92B_000962 [Marinobacter maritimus]|jgi:hypothetical protein